MVTFDKFQTVVTQSNQKTSQKILNFGSKKVNIVLKFLKLTWTFLDFFRPKNKLSQFDHEIIAKSL